VVFLLGRFLENRRRPILRPQNGVSEESINNYLYSHLLLIVAPVLFCSGQAQRHLNPPTKRNARRYLAACGILIFQYFHPRSLHLDYKPPGQ
jgi:hypothetical protein